MLLQGQGKQDVQGFSFGIGRTSDLKSFTSSLDLKVRTVKKRNSDVRQHWWWLLSFVQLYSQSDVAGVNWSRRKGPTKMQQALNAGNVHSKRTVSKPLILSVIKGSFVLLADPRLWWWSLSNTWWQLTFRDWQLVGCYVLARELGILGNGSPWNFRIDVLPPGMIIKICWMALLHYCIIIYMHMWRKQRKSSSEM